MPGTRWKLEVRQATPAEVGVAELKEAVRFEKPVTVTNDGPDTIVNFDYDTEVEAKTAETLAQETAPNSLCFVEEFPV